MIVTSRARVAAGICIVGLVGAALAAQRALRRHARAAALDAGADSDAASASIVGLWAYEASYPVGLRGELTIARMETGWHAEIAGVGAEAPPAGADVRIDFPGG